MLINCVPVASNRKRKGGPVFIVGAYEKHGMHETDAVVFCKYNLAESIKRQRDFKLLWQIKSLS